MNSRVIPRKASKNKENTGLTRPLASNKITFESAGSVFVVDERYQFIKQIGHGAYGVVVSAFDSKTRTKVAIKKVGKAFEDLIDAKRIYREIKLLSHFSHENVIGLLDIERPPGRSGFEDIYIVTDLMETDLHRVVYSRQDLTDEHIQYFMYQLLRGLLFMHSSNVIHRDLKPSNVLLNKNCDLKICDLGLARGFDQAKDDNLTEYVVTRWYRAPEVILNASRYTKAIDVWSVGCIFAELIGRSPLFPGEDYLDQVQRIIAVLGMPGPEDMSFIGNDSARRYLRTLPRRQRVPWASLYPKANPVALDLLNKMLVFNPNKRYSVEECLAHPYFQGLHSPDEEPVAHAPFDWSFDDFTPTKSLLQSLIYEESLKFHPL
jgi:mitogen-activated protein kinase 1/3